MRGLRIGFVGAGWSPAPGGVETVTRDLAEELQVRGHEVAALCLDRSGREEDGERRDFRRAGVHLRRIAWSFQADKALSDLARTPAQETRVLAWAADLELDLVHLHDLSGFGLGVPPRLAELGLPVVWTLHDYWALCPRGQMLHIEGTLCELADVATCGECAGRTWPQLVAPAGTEAALALRFEAARAAFEACARVYSPSRASLALLSRHGIASELCENGLTPALVLPRCSLGETLRVGVLGAVQPSKGVLELAGWIAGSQGIELHVHGPRPSYHGDSAYTSALEALARSSPQVHLHPAYAAHELPQILSTKHLIAVPSLWNEVFGLTAREARLAGLPVFAARVGGLTEGDFELIAPGDKGAWMAAFERFRSDSAWRASLTEECAAPRSMSAVVDQLEADYCALVR